LREEECFTSLLQKRYFTPAERGTFENNEEHP